MGKNDIKLRNVMFPIWLLLLIPTTWVVIIPANYIIDSLVVLITLKCLKIDNIKDSYKKCIFKVFIFGFISDFIGEAVMFLSQILRFDWWYDNITAPVAYDPFSNIFAFFYVLIAIIVAGFFIYLFNFKFSFNKTSLSVKQRKVLSLTLAIATSPYLFLFPSKLLYK